MSSAAILEEVGNRTAELKCSFETQLFHIWVKVFDWNDFDMGSNYLWFTISMLVSVCKGMSWSYTELSAEITNLMTNSANGIQRDINVKGQKLETVTGFVV